MTTGKWSNVAPTVSNEGSETLCAFSRVTIVDRGLNSLDLGSAQRVGVFLDKEIGKGNWRAINCTDGSKPSQAVGIHEVVCPSECLIALKWADVRDGQLRVTSHEFLNKEDIPLIPEDVIKWINSQGELNASPRTEGPNPS